jgi:hypothetical protein
LPATARKVELPQDALPSGSEFERQLEAITISNGSFPDALHLSLMCESEFMDDDLKDALFNDDCDFEELADDFISSVCSYHISSPEF